MPSSRFRGFLQVLISHASRMRRLHQLALVRRILAASQETVWPGRKQCSARADLCECLCSTAFWCSLRRVENLRFVSPIYVPLKCLFPLFQWKACELAGLSAGIAKCMTTINMIYFALLKSYSPRSGIYCQGLENHTSPFFQKTWKYPECFSILCDFCVNLSLE